MTRNRPTVIAVVMAAILLLTLATALARRSLAPAASAIDHPVVLNIKTMIYHCPACDLIRHCGADCATMDISEAKSRGGKPCRICGGDCLAREAKP